MNVLRSQRGFTLVEMMTVLTIIALLSVLIIVNTQVGSRRQQSRDAAAGFVSATRQAESLASSSQAVADASGATTPRKAYGVCITSSGITGAHCDDPAAAGKPADMYQIYARTVADTSPDVQTALTQRPAQPDIIASYRLPQGYTFTNSAVWLDYVPPTPSLAVNGGSANAQVKISYQGATVMNCTRRLDCQFVQVKPLAGAVYVQ